MDPPSELAQVGQRLLQLPLGLSEQHAALPVSDVRPQELEGHTEGEQPLLGTIVQVALQPAPLLIARTHDPRPRLTQLRCMWCVSVSRGRGGRRTRRT